MFSNAPSLVCSTGRGLIRLNSSGVTHTVGTAQGAPFWSLLPIGAAPRRSSKTHR